MDCEIRPAVAGDAESINRIANWYIEHTAVNFDTAAWPPKKRVEWIESFEEPHSPFHLLVAQTAGEIIGFACNTRFRPKAAYDSTTETTVYITADSQSLGCGRLLYSKLLERVAGEQFHRALAVITLPNPASIALHVKMGFREIGVFDEVGRKFGQYHSVAMYQKAL